MIKKSPSFIALFAVLTAAGGLLTLPAGPVPVTFQTLFTLLSGCILGPAGGVMSQALYILMGAAGLPVFSRGGSGLAHLLGPTGGYLFGFMGAAYVSGIFALRGKIKTALIAGSLTVYIVAIPWLGIYTRMSWTQTLAAGFIPFIPGDIIKIFAGLGIWRRLKSSGMLESLK